MAHDAGDISWPSTKPSVTPIAALLTPERFLTTSCLRWASRRLRSPGCSEFPASTFTKSLKRTSPSAPWCSQDRQLIGNGPAIWLRLQAAYDAWHAAREVDVSKIPTLEQA